MPTDLWFWAFLAGAVVVHWVLPVAARGWWIALASLAYLATVGARHEGLWGAGAALVVSLVVFAVAPRLAAPGAKRLVLATVAGLVLLLAVFKYLPPLLAALHAQGALPALVLPLGISYFTFKLIHYAVEASRGNVKDRSLGTFLSWMLLAPIFTAGPIERFDHFVAQRETKWSRVQVVEGGTRIVHGLAKKFVLAEWLVMEHVMPDFKTAAGDTRHAITRAADAFSSAGADVHGSDARWFLVAAFLYAYFDLAGYSDLAIGASRLFGLRILENFDAPLLARNIGTFWKKWHMTLAGWCQSYVYMPALGITRNPYAAVFATFFVMGVWHAANLNYVAWAVYQATGVCVALTWARRRAKRGKRAATSGWRSWWGVPVTLVFFTGSVVFSSTYELGFAAALRLGGRALGIVS